MSYTPNPLWLLLLAPAACAPAAPFSPPNQASISNSACPATPRIPYISPLGNDGVIRAFGASGYQETYGGLCEQVAHFTLGSGALRELRNAPVNSSIIISFGSMKNACPYLPDVKFADIGPFGETSVRLPPDILALIKDAGCVATKKDPADGSAFLDQPLPVLTIKDVPYTFG